MRLIQFFLVLVFALLLAIYFRRWRSRLKDRVLVLIFAGTGSLFVLFPDLTQCLAKTFGVGRGTDFIMYVAVAGLSFSCFLLYAQLREMDRRITELTRALAIERGQSPRG